jgi:predicted N-acetyltransferase YhbS
MYQIREAAPADAKDINIVTRKAFALYRDELPVNSPLAALYESDETVVGDIVNHRVFVAEKSGKILGSIRYCALSGELAYIYRFGVDPHISNTGIGSRLLARVIDECTEQDFRAITLHTNSKYYKLARYYYGKQFYVHSTSGEKG